jgi:hypothetical protein
LMKRRKTGDGIKIGVCAKPREESGARSFQDR